MKNYLQNIFDSENKKFIDAIDEVAIWSAPFGFTLLNTIKMKRGIKALDIGCGTGFPLTELATRLDGASRIYGIDPWDKAVERVKEKISLYEIKNAEVKTGTAENLPFEDGYFDLIVSNNGINNVQDLDKTLSECYRVLKAGGQFVFTFNLPDTFIEFYNIFEETLNDLGLLNEIQKMYGHIFEKRKPIDYMKNIVEQNNFNISEIKEGSFNYRFSDGTSFLYYPMIRFHFLPSWIELLPSQRVEEVFEIIETKLNKAASEKGELIMTVPYACFSCFK
ncbi:MAG: class I SAM-dependent methyltransferase [Ignavibacteriae bacterium]|nr:class I SAM-dependent methyltransferase [Ignavibacteriota bacterium]